MVGMVPPGTTPASEDAVAAILRGPGVKVPPLSWVGVTYKVVTPQFWRHVDVTFFALLL